MHAVDKILGLFYIHNITETFREPLEPIPDYLGESILFFLLMLLLETGIVFVTRKNQCVSWMDTICSMAQGLLAQVFGYLIVDFENEIYVWLWRHWRLFDLPWNSVTSWMFTMLGVDMGYYWFHRFAHECNLFWASHQVHHSSEYYNLSTALRQSMIQTYLSWIFYLPLAFIGVPPSMFFTHAKFNTIYQFWIHTEIVKSLGPLEYVLNTPSHHRVHHGSNVKYLDKNYAGVLIIWDRLFGTFCWEQERPTFGMVHNIETYDMWKIQLENYRNIYINWKKQASTVDKIKSVFYGPGWSSGSGRLGDYTQVPEPDPNRVPFERPLGFWLKVYISVHFSVVSAIGIVLMSLPHIVPADSSLVLAAVVIVSLTSLGWLMDQSPLGRKAEISRCLLMAAGLVYFSYDQPQWIATSMRLTAMLMLSSSMIWLSRTSQPSTLQKIKRK